MKAFLLISIDFSSYKTENATSKITGLEVCCGRVHSWVVKLVGRCWIKKESRNTFMPALWPTWYSQQNWQAFGRATWHRNEHLRINWRRREWTSKHVQSESVKERPDEWPNTFLNCIDARAVLPSSSSITVASCEWQRWGLFGWQWGDPWGRSWPGLWAGHGFPREEQRAATRTRLDHWDWPVVQQRFVQFRNSLHRLEKPSVVTWLSKALVF